MPTFHRWILTLFILCLFGLALFSACGDDDDDNDAGEPADDDDGDDDDDNDDSGDDDDDDDDDDNDDNDDDTEDTDWMFIRDDEGGALIFHGCNLDGSAKGDSGLPDFTEEEVLAIGGDWGFNFVRYLIFWARIEPDQQGVYDEDYLDDVETRLDWAHAAGLTVVLDMHQDLWGPFVRNAGGSDGAPEWATITDGWPHIPFAQILGNWAFDYLSPEVIRAFDNFWAYDRHPELQDAYAAMWAHVIERFKDHPAVLGYDIMNEPYQGLGILRYRQFDETSFFDFNQRVIDAIREEDTEGWIFYEPCAFAANQGLPSYVPVLDDPREGENRLAYFPHLYPVLNDLAGGYYPGLDQTIPRWERNRLVEMNRQQAPLISGEWGMFNWFDEANQTAWHDEALGMFDRITSGWAYWDCGWLRRRLEDEFFTHVTAAYPRRVAGHPTSYGYDQETRTFTLTFEEREGVTGDTEIFLPVDRDYPTGWALDCSDPPDTWSFDYDEETRLLSITTNPEEEEHTITIFPVEL